MRESILNINDWDVKILATDLDSNVIDVARQGIYTQERVAGISESRLKKWFRKGSGNSQGQVKVAPVIQELITFKQLNLMRAWPFKGPFDVIFCRNVVIYFNKDTQRRLMQRYYDMLADEGHLFLGHSESLFRVTDLFELIGNTTYKKQR